VLYLKQASGSELEALVEIPDAADNAGNSNSMGRRTLAELQQAGKPLAGLYEPMELWWKPKDTPESRYMLMDEKKTLPFATPIVTSPATRAYWTWLGSELHVTPINMPYDLLVDARFNPPPLVKDTDVLVAHPDMHLTVIPAALAAVGLEAGNPGWQESGSTQAELAADMIVAQIIRGKQGYTYRAGHLNRRYRKGWFWV